MKLEEEIYNFRDLIEEKTGLYFSEDKLINLEKTIYRIVKDFSYPDFRSLYESLKNGFWQNPHSEKLINLLTTRETYFFRESAHFEILEKHIFPELIDKHKTDKNMIIWSAGCSTGEEAYSIALVLYRYLKNFNNWNIKIFATDINSEYIEKAKKGLYNSWSFREKPVSESFNNYFVERGNQIQIIPEIRKIVYFQKHNILDKYDGIPGSVDVVFCRNLLMYFKKARINSALNTFFHYLSSGGYLFVSQAEMIPPGLKNFRILHFPRAVVYQKCPAKRDCKHRRMAGKKTENPGKEEVSFNKKEGTIKYPQTNCDDGEKAPGSPDEFIKIAMTLADKGRFDKAREWCEKALAKDRLFTEAYYVLAVICEARREYDRATEYLKKVVYLDNTFISGYYNLGRLYDKTGNIEQRDKCYRNVLRLLELRNKEEIIPLTGDLTCSELSEMIRGVMPVKASL